VKVLTSQEGFAYKQQLKVIREQLVQIEERGVYGVAGNTIRTNDREEYRNLVKMEYHLKQLAAGIEKPKAYEKPKHSEIPPQRGLTDEEWEELAKNASEAFKEFRGCADTREKEKSSEDTVEAQETHVAGRG
jgi:hypothetical protein